MEVRDVALLFARLVGLADRHTKIKNFLLMMGVVAFSSLSIAIRCTSNATQRVIRKLLPSIRMIAALIFFTAG